GPPSCVRRPVDGGRGKLLRAGADLHDEAPRFPDMFGRAKTLGAEEPQIGDGDREGYAPRLAWLQQDLLETLELAYRARPAGHGMRELDLVVPPPGHGPGAAHREGRIEPLARPPRRRLVALERDVFKRAVAKAVAERIQRR